MKAFWILTCLFGYLITTGLLASLAFISTAQAVDPTHAIKWTTVALLINIVVSGSAFAFWIQNANKD